MTNEIKYGAKQRPSGAWLPYIRVNGKFEGMDWLIKKSKRGALTAAKNLAASKYPRIEATEE